MRIEGPPVILGKLSQTGASNALPEVLSFAQEWRAGVDKRENWMTVLDVAPIKPQKPNLSGR